MLSSLNEIIVSFAPVYLRSKAKNNNLSFLLHCYLVTVSRSIMIVFRTTFCLGGWGLRGWIQLVLLFDRFLLCGLLDCWCLAALNRFFNQPPCQRNTRCACDCFLPVFLPKERGQANRLPARFSAHCFLSLRVKAGPHTIAIADDLIFPCFSKYFRASFFFFFFGSENRHCCDRPYSIRTMFILFCKYRKTFAVAKCSARVTP